MKKITINKMAQVAAPAKDQAVAYQVIEFVINFFGNITTTTHDTAIYADGRQEVIGGCGFIPHGSAWINWQHKPKPFGAYNAPRRITGLHHMKTHLQSYLLWKQNLHIVPDLTMTKWGAFNNSSIQRQYNAYRQALADYLPKKAPDDVLDAMVDAGCRAEWAQSIYQAMRKQMLDKSRSTKLTNGEKNHE